MTLSHTTLEHTNSSANYVNTGIHIIMHTVICANVACASVV